ncbi:Ribosome production factor 1 [Microbotryomycetes sp. JL201]|nr:Ribosome production factor 1 [Microbotryomycetes sp. JL201]
MPLAANDIRKVRNKIVRGQLLAKHRKEQQKDKLKRRIARREAEKRGEVVEKGFTRTIENTREWLGDDEEYADPRTRPAQVDVDGNTGDVRVDLGSLATLFPATAEQDEHSTQASTSTAAASAPLPRADAKVLITTSPGKKPAKFVKEFLDDLQALLGGKSRADVVPRKNPKYELGKVARWARKRGYGAIAVVGEDHQKPTSLTLSLLPYGPTAHFRLTGVTLCKDIPGHAKPTSHPPELVLNHFQTPLGLSLASLLSQLFLPPTAAEVLSRQGFAGRQVVLAQNSRDFVFVRRYRYMFVLKSHQLGKTVKKKQELEKMRPDDPEDDDTIKTRFQEIGPRMTVKMRWIRRGALGETQEERQRRQASEQTDDADLVAEFGETAKGQGVEMDEVGEERGDERMNVDGDEEYDDDAEEERAAAKAVGLDGNSDQPHFNMPDLPEETTEMNNASQANSVERDGLPLKRPRDRPRNRKKPSHPLLRPSPSPEPEDEPSFVPLPPRNGKKQASAEEQSALSTVGKTWHPGKGEGGVREDKKTREWEWHARMQVSRRKFFL